MVAAAMRKKTWVPGDPVYEHPNNVVYGSLHIRPIFQLYPLVEANTPIGYMRWRNDTFYDDMSFEWIEKPESGPWTWLQPR